MSTERALQSWPDLVKILVALALAASPWYFDIGMHTETWILVVAALAAAIAAGYAMASPSDGAQWTVLVLAIVAGAMPWVNLERFASLAGRSTIGVLALLLVALAAYSLYRSHSGKGGPGRPAHAST
jgi:uncharacterized membrane protein